ncbi:MAG: TadE/TadG family type IV pilus assembly protein [Pseudomonadota bacterium]
MIKFLHIKKIQGITSVEFALVSLVFFMLMFGVLEVGRLMFSLSMIEETSRRITRLAAVCPVTERNLIIAREVNRTGINRFNAGNIDIDYLNNNLAEVAVNAQNINTITFVRTRVINYQHALIIPLVELQLDPTAIRYESILPSESLGFNPDNGGQITCI